MRRQGHDKGICSLRDEFGFSQLMWQCLLFQLKKETEAPSKRNKSLPAPYPRGKSEMEEFRGAYPLALGPGACVFLWRVLRSRLPLLLAEKGGPCLHPSAGGPSTHCKVLGDPGGPEGDCISTDQDSDAFHQMDDYTDLPKKGSIFLDASEFWGLGKRA